MNGPKAAMLPRSARRARSRPTPSIRWASTPRRHATSRVGAGPERARRRAERQALSVEARGAASNALAHHVWDLLAARFGSMQNCVFSAYWPIKGEPDLRRLMADLHASGVRVALPVVEVKHAPLVFRRWTPETRMVRGDWNIPVPTEEAEAVTPDVVLTPLVVWDRSGCRLGLWRRLLRSHSRPSVSAPLCHRHRAPGGRARDDLSAAARHEARCDRH